MAETTTVIPGMAAPLRTLVVRENAASGNHRWHTLFILHDPTTPALDLLHEYRSRQHHEQAYRIGVHDLMLDTVPSGYPVSSIAVVRGYFAAAFIIGDLLIAIVLLIGWIGRRRWWPRLKFVVGEDGPVSGGSGQSG